MRFINFATRVAAAVTVLFAASLTTSGSAQAASTPEATCGAGYYAIDHYDLQIAVGWLMYNGSTDCVVTWKTQQIGTKTPLVASVGSQNATNVPYPTHGRYGNSNVDFDAYDYYAGPVYWYAPHTCIEWYVSDPYVSGGSNVPVHCG
ncbi:hypothetical protein [Nocardia sp. NPDC020380]|uniref:hypothetical protein n=1 Tax=Nocardia sp. NPDC020380 TaxID=3364309 RepID=UPI0037994DA4